MTLKTIATGSTGNCYILTSDSGKHLILDAGIPIGEIKKGLDFDIGNVCACIITHVHKDHSLSANKLKTMGIPVWRPYLSDHVRMRIRFDCFKVECFDLPHSVPCRGFIIEADDLKILYASDFEYIKYSFSDYGINVMLIEMNYQQKIMDKLDVDSHIAHTVTGHASDVTTTEFILHNKKYLQNVILCHYSKSGNMNRDEALAELQSKLPEYIDMRWAIPGEEVMLGCTF
jgi:Cft2 family RNA processing exonuclease